MKLTLFTDYSFRLLIMAGISHPNLVTIPQTAMRYRISRHHLTKVANELVRGGYLEAVRGRNGGLRLARPLSSVKVSDIVRFCEGNPPLVECFDKETNTCPITPHCTLKTILYSAENAFYAVLSSHTLADLIAHKGELQIILE
jgi:Rrf2 family transcriptional regulator, nitric oxide-sensitive transcriptional repressor